MSTSPAFIEPGEIALALGAEGQDFQCSRTRARRVLDRRNVRFRNVAAFAIDAFDFSTFFGGSDPSWAPVKDEHVTFDQFVVSTARA